MTYDGNGNVTKDHRGWTYTYDAENRLHTVTNASSVQVETFYYNADGTRRSSNASGVAYYDGDQEIINLAYNGSNFDNHDVTRRYVRIPGSVDEAFLMIDYTGSCGASGCYSYAHSDARGRAHPRGRRIPGRKLMP